MKSNCNKSQRKEPIAVHMLLSHCQGWEWVAPLFTEALSQLKPYMSPELKSQLPPEPAITKKPVAQENRVLDGTWIALLIIEHSKGVGYRHVCQFRGFFVFFQDNHNNIRGGFLEDVSGYEVILSDAIAEARPQSPLAVASCLDNDTDSRHPDGIVKGRRHEPLSSVSTRGADLD